jgi:hypothetical protein
MNYLDHEARLEAHQQFQPRESPLLFELSPERKYRLPGGNNSSHFGMCHREGPCHEFCTLLKRSVKII